MIIGKIFFIAIYIIVGIFSFYLIWTDYSITGREEKYKWILMLLCIAFWPAGLFAVVELKINKLIDNYVRGSQIDRKSGGNSAW